MHRRVILIILSEVHLRGLGKWAQKTAAKRVHKILHENGRGPYPTSRYTPDWVVHDVTEERKVKNHENHYHL